MCATNCKTLYKMDKNAKILETDHFKSVKGETAVDKLNALKIPQFSIFILNDGQSTLLGFAN